MLGAARRALIWSFFVPPVGLVLGIRARREALCEPRDPEAEKLAWGAVLNGGLSTVLIPVLIAAAYGLYRLWRFAGEVGI